MKETVRDASHADFIERWAEFVRTHPRSVWKPIHTRFIDAQYEKAQTFYKRLKKTKEGREILARLE